MDLNKRTRRTKLIIRQAGNAPAKPTTNKQHQTILGNNDQESKQAKYLHKWQNQ
jgi:hypothetical protein